MTLTEKWETCPTCAGSREAYITIDGNNLDHTQDCPDCVDGLVPPEGMIEAAAEVIWRDRNAWCACDEHPKAGIDSSDRELARAALVAAKRWEKEQ